MIKVKTDFMYYDCKTPKELAEAIFSKEMGMIDFFARAARQCVITLYKNDLTLKIPTDIFSGDSLIDLQAIVDWGENDGH